MTDPYIRAAAKHPHIREQIAERASKRPEFAAKPEKLQKLQVEMGKPVKPDKPVKPEPPDKPTGGGGRQRARNEAGQFAGDNPKTPTVNEAWTDGQNP